MREREVLIAARVEQAISAIEAYYAELDPNSTLRKYQATVNAAARKYLAQQPPYQPDLVERIATAIAHEGKIWTVDLRRAVAALDALNGETET